ncbi:hypothetical protein AVENLUH5627_00148 [Acinetobacter venetianus]|uniref:Uncharacterized protein n=1 Tax=Acinetobacter venetianus TaxID=52133 RepID=A0A150I320_9GAMM|nr:hypothetical protein [Acinetobacter venetianus]KXZ74213.1 hypothetical protein AVENLUH5627_00148 [Acinetobacter venetianus]
MINRKNILYLLILPSTHLFADRYGVYDDDYVSSGGDNILYGIILLIFFGFLAFNFIIKSLIKLLELIQVLLRKHDYNSKCRILKIEIKRKIKNLILQEVKNSTKSSKSIKYCYLIPLVIIHFLLLMNDIYAETILLSLLLLTVFTLLIGVVLHFFYVAFIEVSAYFRASKKYKQFRKLPHNYDELLQIKNIVDSI